MKLILKLFSFVAMGWMAAASPARAELNTHVARVDLDLIEIDDKAKEDRIETIRGKVYLNWDSKSCKLETRKSEFPCLLDTSEDIVNSKGELVMKSLPQLKFSSDTVNILLLNLLMDDHYPVKDLARLLVETSRKREPQFKLPFYSCIDCENNGKDLRLMNAFYSEVSRGFLIEHPLLGNKKLKMVITLKKIEPLKGAFYTIGNDNAAEYGQ